MLALEEPAFATVIGIFIMRRVKDNDHPAKGFALPI
jgi:hypothetical protein